MSVIYVDDSYHQREWMVGPPIAVVASIEVYLAMPVSSDVLIIHGGQRDAAVAAPSGRPLLFEAVVRVCRGGGRAVIFSGGHGAIAMARNHLRRESLEEGCITCSFRQFKIFNRRSISTSC